MKRSVLAMLAGGVVLVTAAGLWWKLGSSLGRGAPGNEMSPEAEAASLESAPEGDSSGHVVTLTEEKLTATSIQIAEVSRHRMQPCNTVPGRLRYDDQRHVEVRVASGGILTSVLVKPGDRVTAGQVLAELNSAEVGNARADVLQRESELVLATKQRDWDQAICKGLKQMNAAIQQRLPLEQIEQQFRDVPLGSFREQVLTNYSQLILAESLTQSALDSATTGAVPRKLLQERQSERDSAEAALQGTLEQLLFSASQTCRQAEIMVEDSQRRLRISRQNVATLLGTFGGQGSFETSTSDFPEVLSLVQIRAPFAGTIEQRRFSISERVADNDAVFVLADTSTLWVAADLRDRDRGALTLQTGDQVEVFLSPHDGIPEKATVSFVGREVDPTNNAIPLIAVLPNASGTLRPGMFVQVRVPVAEGRDVLAVPESAVMEHESQAFVFMPEGHQTFRRVDISTAQRMDDLVEVVTGLSSGDRIVVSGGFILKSELLLEGEEE